MEVFTVIFLALGGYTESCVSGRDFHEARRGIGVGGVAVWMVEFGERIKLSVKEGGAGEVVSLVMGRGRFGKGRERRCTF